MAQLGHGLAQAKITLVYGGGHVGLMGAVADSALKAGGRVIGIIPTFLHQREVMHQGVTELEITPDMHTRKARMFELSDCFAILPGGFGTFDEMMEIVTWRQLNLHSKPIIVLNVKGWANSLIQTLDDAVAQGFVEPETRGFIQVCSDVDAFFALVPSL
ncbi:lysine decarboxylase [Neokomagataea thailandica NBRC 106555]|nr:lysine decarboxylase [Neokomagataea thailandica NBRC 106555]